MKSKHMNMEKLSLILLFLLHLTTIEAMNNSMLSLYDLLPLAADIVTIQTLDTENQKTLLKKCINKDLRTVSLVLSKVFPQRVLDEIYLEHERSLTEFLSKSEERLECLRNILLYTNKREFFFIEDNLYSISQHLCICDKKGVYHILDEEVSQFTSTHAKKADKLQKILLPSPDTYFKIGMEKVSTVLEREKNYYNALYYAIDHFVHGTSQVGNEEQKPSDNSFSLTLLTIVNNYLHYIDTDANDFDRYKLFRAVKRGHIDFVKLFLNTGVDVAKAEYKGKTFLELAEKVNNEEMIKLLKSKKHVYYT